MSEPWVRFEDDHLLVVSKPAGVRARRDGPHGQDGIVDWVRRQRPDRDLALVHDVGREVSGLVVLAASAPARQVFGDRALSPTTTHELLTRRDDRRGARLRTTGTGEAIDGATTFELLDTGAGHQRYVARSESGRGATASRVRDHARALGMAVLGDRAGEAAPRLFLHEASIRFQHPTGGWMELAEPAPASFRLVLERGVDDHAAAQVAADLRAVWFDPSQTDAFVWIDRHHDGFARVRVERLGPVALALDFREPVAPLPPSWVDAWLAVEGVEAVYHQQRPRTGANQPAVLVAGEAPARFEVGELGCRYRIDLDASPTSSGLFLDQRETRRRLLHTDLRERTVLNVFAHTGSLSVAAALAGAETLTQDLSTGYLDWARDNLLANSVDPDDHDFVYGDALDWMGRFARRGRRFDVVLVDPPSSSTTRKGKRWSVARDLHGLVELGATLTAPGGTLFVSTNLAKLTWPKFLDHLARGLADAGRDAGIETATLPLDHRTSRDDPPYLKAAWLSLDRGEPT